METEMEMQNKINEVIAMSTSLGFNMGTTSMRLKIMEALMPYLEGGVLASDLLTSRDVVNIVADAMKDFDVETEYELFSKTMKGLHNVD